MEVNKAIVLEGKRKKKERPSDSGVGPVHDLSTRSTLALPCNCKGVPRRVHLRRNRTRLPSGFNNRIQKPWALSSFRTAPSCIHPVPTRRPIPTRAHDTWAHHTYSPRHQKPRKRIGGALSDLSFSLIFFFLPSRRNLP